MLGRPNRARAGNTPDWARWVRGQLQGIRFDALPHALDAPIALGGGVIIFNAPRCITYNLSDSL